jgi:hypothetical protein
MTTNDEVWIPEPEAWGLDRLAWEDDEDGYPVDLDESPEAAPDGPD